MNTMQRRRVVITGMGTLNPCGNSVGETWDNLLAGRSGITAIDRFDATDFACKIAGDVKGFNPDDYVDRKEQKKMDLFIQYAMAAATQAMKDAGLYDYPFTKDEREVFGVCIGSGIGGLKTIWDEAHAYRGPRRTSPFFIPA